MYKNMQCRPLPWKDKIENASTQILMRFAFKLCINNYQIHSWKINAFLMTFEAKKPIKLISKSRCPILHAFKTIRQYS